MREVAGLVNGGLSEDICSRAVRRSPARNKLNKECSSLRSVAVFSQ